MSGLKQIKETKKARIGLYSAGLKAYWEQFAGQTYSRLPKWLMKKLGQTGGWHSV